MDTTELPYVKSILVAGTLIMAMMSIFHAQVKMQQIPGVC